MKFIWEIWVYIGECGQGTAVWDDAIQSTCELDALNSARSGGYAGVGIWNYEYPGSSDYLAMVNTNGSWRAVCYTIQGWNYAVNLNMQISGSNLLLSWPTNAAGLYLQNNVNPGNTAGWVRYTIVTPPVVVNGQFVVTLPITSDQQGYYRLSSQ